MTLNVNDITSIAKEKGFVVENLGELGLSMRTNELSVSFMKRGSAVLVGPKAVSYTHLTLPTNREV